MKCPKSHLHVPRCEIYWREYLVILFDNRPKQSMDDLNCCWSANCFRVQMSQISVVRSGSADWRWCHSVGNCSSKLSYSLCNDACCFAVIGLDRLSCFICVRSASQRHGRGDELKTSQQGGLIVVCKLENAHWVPHWILMEAKKKMARVKLHMGFNTHSWFSGDLFSLTWPEDDCSQKTALSVT